MELRKDQKWFCYVHKHMGVDALAICSAHINPISMYKPSGQSVFILPTLDTHYDLFYFIQNISVPFPLIIIPNVMIYLWTMFTSMCEAIIWKYCMLYYHFKKPSLELSHRSMESKKPLERTLLYTFSSLWVEDTYSPVFTKTR